MSPLRVCYFGAYDPAYPRNAILREGLRRCGTRVVECCVSPRTPIVLRPGALLARFAALPVKRFDAFVVAELNPEVVWLARLLGAPWRTPVILDLFFSKYDAAVHDRATVRPYHPRALAFKLIEGAAMRTADLVLADTAAHAAYYRAAFSLRRTRFEVVPVGAGDRLFHPPETRRTGPAGCLVGFWGTYIPLHGVATIVEAAALLRDEPVRFELVGRGQTFAETATLARHLGLANLSLSPPVPSAELARFARRCDVALGIFGQTAKAGRVVPHKVYQAMLSGLPVVTRDSPAVREFFRQGEHLLLVPPGDARALAEAIRGLVREPMLRLGLGHAAHACVSSRFTPGPIGERLAAAIEGLLKRPSM
jgi:glycosyltransferase involved in cell wall biosynthesis